MQTFRNREVSPEIDDALPLDIKRSEELFVDDWDTQTNSFHHLVKGCTINCTIIGLRIELLVEAGENTGVNCKYKYYLMQHIKIPNDRTIIHVTTPLS